MNTFTRTVALIMNFNVNILLSGVFLCQQFLPMVNTVG
jgi:hypothetical protein